MQRHEVVSDHPMGHHMGYLYHCHLVCQPHPQNHRRRPPAGVGLHNVPLTNQSTSHESAYTDNLHKQQIHGCRGTLGICTNPGAAVLDALFQCGVIHQFNVMQRRNANMRQMQCGPQ